VPVDFADEIGQWFCDPASAFSFVLLLYHFYTQIALLLTQSAPKPPRFIAFVVPETDSKKRTATAIRFNVQA